MPHTRSAARVLAILAAVLIPLLLSACAILGIGADAEVAVAWSRPAPGGIGEIVSFTVTNTGTLTLTSVDMQFRVTYESGNSYRETWSVFDLEPGRSVSGECWVTTNESGQPVKDVDCVKVSLKTW